MAQLYSKGEAWYDETADKEYRVVGVEVSYTLEVLAEDGQTGEIRSETVRYPQESLTRKLDQDGLIPVDEQQTDSDPSDAGICPDCGESFAGERGVSQHQRQSECGDE